MAKKYEQTKFLFDIYEVAEMTGVAPQRIYEYVGRGEIPSFQLSVPSAPSKHYFLLSQIDKVRMKGITETYENPDLLTKNEAAHFLNVSEYTIRVYRRFDGLPWHYGEDGKVYFKRKDLEDFMKWKDRKSGKRK